MVKPLRRNKPEQLPAVPEPVVGPSAWSGLPGPHGALSLHASAKMRHDMVDAVVTANRLDLWLIDFTAEHRPDANRQWFMEKMFVKGLPRSSNAELTVSAGSVEELLSRIDAGEGARVISPDGFTIDAGADDA